MMQGPWPPPKKNSPKTFPKAPKTNKTTQTYGKTKSTLITKIAPESPQHLPKKGDHIFLVALPDYPTGRFCLMTQAMPPLQRTEET